MAKEWTTDHTAYGMTQPGADPGLEDAPLSPLAKQRDQGEQDVTKPTISTDAHKSSLSPDVTRVKNAR